MGEKTGRRSLLAAAGAAVVTGCLGSTRNRNGGGVSGSDGTGEGETLPERGDDSYIQEVESFESKGREHVDGEVEYERTPPLSGPHAGQAAGAGFCDERQPPEQLVHSLEHGAVVAYYDPDALTEGTESDLRERASRHTDPLASVIVVPSLRDDPESPYTLAAWRHRLRLSEYDRDAVTAFIAEYLGRGPVRPVR